MMVQDATINAVDDRDAQRMAESAGTAPLIDEWSDERWGMEIQSGVEYTQSIMEKSRPRIERYGNGFRSGWNEHPDDLNNFPLKFMNMFTATHASGCPRVRTQSYRGPSLIPVAMAVQEGSNGWAVADHFDKKLNQSVWDVGFDFGVLALYLEGRDDPEGAQTLTDAGFPVDDVADALCSCRILPNRYIQDPKASDPDSVRWAGHFEPYEIEDAKEMLRDHGATEEEVTKLDAMIGDAAREMRSDVCGYIGEVTNSDEVVILHMWRRRTQTMHFFGVTSKKDARPVQLCAPQPFHGPLNGPYTVMGVRWIRGNALPLAPLASTDSVLDESNAHRGQMRDDARTAKQNVRYNNPEDAATHNNAPNAAAIVITDDSDKSGEVIKVGGINEENLKASELCDRELDSITGYSAPAQGAVGESNNATEVAEASDKMAVRTNGEKMIFRSRVAEVFRKVAWYILNTPNMRVAIESVDPKTGAKRQRMLVGGEPDNGITPEDLGIDIVPYSHEYVGEQQQRENNRALTEDLFGLLDRAKVDPIGVNYTEIWRRMTDQQNYGDGATELVDWNVITQQAAMAQQAAMMGPEVGGGGGSGEKPQKPAGNLTQEVRSGAAKMGANARRAR